MESLALTLGGEVLLVGGQAYLQHRQNMINEDKEDDLISSKVKRFSQEIIKSLSREPSSMLRFDNVYIEEESDDDIPDEKSKISFSQKIRRKSINGVNSAMDFLRKSYNKMQNTAPIKQRPETIVEDGINVVNDAEKLILDTVILANELKPQMKTMMWIKQ
jgi:hypothetical protein